MAVPTAPGFLKKLADLTVFCGVNLCRLMLMECSVPGSKLRLGGLLVRPFGLLSDSSLSSSGHDKLWQTVVAQGNLQERVPRCYPVRADVPWVAFPMHEESVPNGQWLFLLASSRLSQLLGF